MEAGVGLGSSATTVGDGASPEGSKISSSVVEIVSTSVTGATGDGAFAKACANEAFPDAMAREVALVIGWLVVFACGLRIGVVLAGGGPREISKSRGL